jgi:predicted MPP superfamily phosphohydrolase
MLGKTVLGLSLTGSGGLFYAQEVESRWLDVVRLDLKLPHLAPHFEGYRIVHISDLHLDRHTPFGYLDEVRRLVNGEEADLISFTGDFVTFEAGRFASGLTSLTRGLEASDGVFAVLGNHEYLTDPDVVMDALGEAGARTLRNEVHTLEREGGYLSLCGVDDVWVGRPDLEQVLRDLPAMGTAILLAHEPDFADSAAHTGRFDLQLSGHSHGGQVRLPYVGAPWLPRYARKYPLGLYVVDGMPLYTNRGLGMLPPRLRFRCRPEVTSITLSSRSNSMAGMECEKSSESA